MQACIVSHKDWNLPKIDSPPGRQEIKHLSGQVPLPLWLPDPGVTLQRLGVLCYCAKLSVSVCAHTFHNPPASKVVSNVTRSGLRKTANRDRKGY